MLAALGQMGPRRVIGPRYAYWAWELPRAPKTWLSDAAMADEVWVPSRYVAQALDGARRRVRVVLHPLFLEDYAGVAPAPKRAGFQAVALFDFNSSAARKNPQGAIAAFAQAFGEDAEARLVLKTQNGARHPAALADLRQAAPANVEIIDETWPYAQVKALIAGSDVLLSLHRAEGFGLTPAEALALGTPVVATGWSGVTDFLDESVAILVPSGRTGGEDPQGIYRGQTWAEPDLAFAAQALRELRADPERRRTLAAAGRRRVAERLSPQAWFTTLPDQVKTAAMRAAQNR